MKRTRTVDSVHPSFGEDREQTSQPSIPSHVYLNLSIINSDISDSASSQPQQVFFSETRTTPIIQNAADYEMSVVRFNANGIGRLLPLYIPVMKTLTQTTYSVTVSGFGGVNPVQVYMNWTPEFQDAPRPYTPNAVSLYYYGRTYTHFANLFNDAFWAAVNPGVPVDSTSPAWKVLSYSPGSSLFTVNLPAAFMWSATPPGTIPTKYLYFNNPLGLLLANFPLLSQSSLVNSSGKQFLLDTRGQTGPISQDFPSTGDTWSPIDTFVFTTAYVPVITEAGGVPLVIGEDNLGPNQSVTNGFQSILTDFVPGVSGGAEDAITTIVYTPSGEYRMVSPSSTGPIQRIDVKLWWRYRLTGELVPVYLPNMASVSMKLLFRSRFWHSGLT